MRRTYLLVLLVVLLGASMIGVAQTGQTGSGQGGRRGAQGSPRGGLPARDTAEPATGTARVRGTVVAADTGTPLRRAYISLGSRELREGRSTTTDAQGRYEFKDLPAGRYQLAAMKSGYVQLQYGQRRAFEQGRPLELRDGQALDGVNFALPRGSVITGRIIDEFGDPVADAMVNAMRYQYFRGKRRLMPAGRGTMTNDLGQYRLYGLPPGEYYVSASVRGFVFMEQTSEDVTGFAPTYFPGTSSAGEAQRVAVAIGQEAIADFGLIPARLVRVSGSVIDSAGRPVTTGVVRLVERSEGGGGVRMFGFTGGRIRQDGSFTIGGVAPGTYTLTASAREFGPASENEDAESGSLPVSVGGENLAGLLLTTSKGATATGQIVAEGAPATFSPTALRIFAMAVDPDEGPGEMGFSQPARVADDWTFELRNIFGRRMLNVNGLPSGWQVKAVYVGGQDVTDTGFEGRPGQRLQGLQVVVTGQGTEISGTVVDDRGTPLKDYVVAVFAEDETKWAHPLARYSRVGRPDQEGTYSITGLPPGEYLAVALDYLENGAADNPEILARLRDVAVGLRLAEGEKKALPLKLAQPAY